MDWNDVIVLTAKEGHRLVVPKSIVKFIGTRSKHSFNPEKDHETVIHLDAKWVKESGIDAKFMSIQDNVLVVWLDMDLNVLLGLMRGDKAAGVLF